MNAYTTKVLMFFLAAFILITVISQTYFMLDEQYTTETALPYSATDSIIFDGVCLRDEKVITYIGSGVLSYCVPDGGKLAGGSEIAFIYGKESDILVNREIADLQGRLEILKKIQNPGTVEAAQPKIVSSLIEDKYKEISAIIERGELEKLDSSREELLVLLSTMQIISGEASDFSGAIAQVEAQIMSLKDRQVEPSGTITAEESGYFVSVTDGLEGELNTSSASDITSDQIDAILSREASSPPNAMGKLIESYKWKIAGVIDNSMKNFSGGDRVNIRVSGVSEDFTATIEEIRDTDDLTKSVIIISCSRLTGELAALRSPKIEIHKSNYDGIKVPRSAIRFENGLKGVYVKRGETAVFRKIEVIFESADYIISKAVNENGYLEMYDDIILEGVTANDG